MAQLLNEHYVFPDVALQSGAHLQAKLASGAFDGIVEARTYAEALTRSWRSRRCNCYPTRMPSLSTSGTMMAAVQRWCSS
ncbi:MAG: hypothetical protein LC667_20255 [Thioalkalivibrio sp.]|nr:hypothetical protein [Thioalkalivibrio sp.]